MSTKSTIGFRLPDGTVSATYCHFNGSPETMVPNIEDFISIEGVETFIKTVKKAQKGGGLRDFGSSLEDTEVYDDATEPWVTTRKDILSDRYEEYCYIVDSKTGDLVEYYDHDGKQTLSALDERLGRS